MGKTHGFIRSIVLYFVRAVGTLFIIYYCYNRIGKRYSYNYY